MMYNIIIVMYDIYLYTNSLLDNLVACVSYGNISNLQEVITLYLCVCVFYLCPGMTMYREGAIASNHCFGDFSVVASTVSGAFYT